MTKTCLDNLGEMISELSTDSGQNIQWIPSCSSTNAVVEEWASTGWRGCLLTDVQTAGRGRLQRRWDSNTGENILLSWVKDWTCPLSDVPRLTLLLAAELAHELDLYVKWPNDIMTEDGKKVGGILSSIHTLGTDTHTVIIGLGINVNQVSFAADLQASSLKQIHGTEQSRIVVLKHILKAMDRVHPTESLDRWTERSITLGKLVETGGRVGVATGIRQDGALIVDGVPVTSGDVNLVEI
jgi:BirA family biotin operon repressor/biotin-[acetyl-CoA-carboxylase] ligase